MGWEMLRAYLVNRSDLLGGAARAAYRLHIALLGLHVESNYLVEEKSSDDWRVLMPKTTFGKLITRVQNALVSKILASSFLDSKTLLSINFFNSNHLKYINSSNVDVIHLHWIHGEMLSIADIGKLNKPLVWTLHDMWAFCGATHYASDDDWMEGYQKKSRGQSLKLFWLNKLVWNHKRRSWRRPMHIIAPSHWMASCAKRSRLLKDWPIHVIPNGIDTSVWSPMGKSMARSILALPGKVSLLLFGAVGGAQDPRKGFDLLSLALRELSKKNHNIELMVFGQTQPEKPVDLGFPIHFMGNLHDDLSLRVLYCAADALVIPSRQDNLPNTGLEAMACGTPVVAFNTGGMADIVTHKATGYLAEPFSTDDLAHGISWVLSEVPSERLQGNSRSTAVQRFSYPVIAKQHIEVYETAKAAFDKQP
jgi:glycosyltransferase involved in cell wall biosynthesis